MLRISVKTQIMPSFMPLIWQKDITQKLSFYILFHMFVICTLKGRLIGLEDIAKAKKEELVEDLEEIKKSLQL